MTLAYTHCAPPNAGHAQQHLSEVGGIHTARAGADGHHCGTFVIFAVEQGLDFHVGRSF